MKYKVAEKFSSINGEGRFSGQLAVFIRFAGCNLQCSYCDTAWAQEKDVPYELMTTEEIYEYILASEIRNVTLTGGEPLLQKGILERLQLLAQDDNLAVEIETNGSISVEEVVDIKKNPPKLTMDYKLPASNMEDKMLTANFQYLRQFDTVKFVVGSGEDLERAKQIIDRYELKDRVYLYVSPVFGKIQLKELVEFMKKNKLNGVTLQVQLHKVIWGAEMRGV